MNMNEAQIKDQTIFRHSPAITAKVKKEQKLLSPNSQWTELALNSLFYLTIENIWNKEMKC